MASRSLATSRPRGKRAIPGPGGERSPHIATARVHLGNGQWLLATAVQPTREQSPSRDDDGPKRRTRRAVFGRFRRPRRWDPSIRRVEHVMPPRQVAAHGLRTGVMMLAGGIDEAKTWLQACEHRRTYGESVHAPPPPNSVRWSKGMPYHDAWTQESIGLHSHERKYAIIVDRDLPDAHHRLLEAIDDGLVPAPSWDVVRTSNGYGHAVWVLAEPIHTGPEASLKPLQAAWCVFQHFCEVLGGDRRYLQLQTHNPVYRGKRAAKYETHWMSRRPYSLAQLLAYLPDEWQPTPRPGHAPRGGSQALFIDGMRWAGRWANRDLPAIDELKLINDNYNTRASDEQVAVLADHIEAERDKWRTRPEGWHSEEFLAKQAARGRKGGLASGRSRARKNSERNENIADYIADGHTQAAAAVHFGLSQSTICEALKAHRKRHSEESGTVSQPKNARRSRSNPGIGEANDPPRRAPARPLPGVSVSDRGRDSQDPKPLRTRGGSGGGRPRPENRPEIHVRSPRTALAEVRRSDVRQPVDFGDLATPSKPVRKPQRTPDPPIPDKELETLAAAVERNRKRVEIDTGGPQEPPADDDPAPEDEVAHPRPADIPVRFDPAPTATKPPRPPPDPDFEALAAAADRNRKRVVFT